MARKKKVKVPKEVITSECRTVPKTECVDGKVNMVMVVMVAVFQMMSKVENGDIGYTRGSGNCLGVYGVDDAGDGVDGGGGVQERCVNEQM